MDRQSRWTNAYQLLTEYITRNGGPNWDKIIPQNYSEKNINLGQWVSRQKIALKNKKISDERINLLKKVNFPFDYWYSRKSQNYKKWNQKLDIFIQNKNDSKIKKWTSVQRKLYFSDKLDPKRKKILEENNFDWKQQNVRWKTILKISLKEIDKYDLSYILNNTITVYNINISRWIKIQIKNFDNLSFKKQESIKHLI